MTKLCENCGTSNKDTSKYCANCGAELKIKKEKTQKSKSGGFSNWWNAQNNGIKGLTIFGACCLGLIVILGIFGMLMPDATDSSSNYAPTSADTEVNTSSSDTPDYSSNSSEPTSTDTSSSDSSSSGIEIRVIADGSWSGSYGDDSGQQSVDGSGTKTFTISGDPYVVSAVFQKEGSGNDKLTVEILEDGVVVESKSTTADYGVVSVGHSFF